MKRGNDLLTLRTFEERRKFLSDQSLACLSSQFRGKRRERERKGKREKRKEKRKERERGDRSDTQ